MSRIRRATHAGSWYYENADQLRDQLNNWLSRAPLSHTPARAIIAPHAGYYYCGSCGAHSYKQVDPRRVKRVFILGPSHHVRLHGCALSPNDYYQTPLGDLTIDKQVYSELYSTGHFETMSSQTDEEEHSIEMQLPFIAKIMDNTAVTIVPVLVGSLSVDLEALYGRLFSPYLADSSNLFVISSDFCHWGARFKYTYYDSSIGEVHKSIEHLDRMGMDIIESLDPAAFAAYLQKYENTICGRHPIGVLLHAVATMRKGNGHTFCMKFVKYAQSSKCHSTKDSSVSYSAAVLTIQR